MKDLSRFKVVISDSMHVPMDIEIQTLSEAGIRPEIYSCVTEDEVIEACRDADGIVNGFAPFTRRVIENLNKCKIIARAGIGYDNVDVAAATEKKIYVTNLPTYCINEVADHALALLMAVNRKIIYADRCFRNHDWDMSHLAPVKAFEGRTMGLIGFGRIGSMFAKRVAVLGCNILVYDPYLPAEAVEKQGYTYTSDIDQIYRESDFISMHLPLTEKTKYFIGEKELAKMKKDAILLNVSRGKLIDEAALAKALNNGVIGGAGIDVFESELPPQRMPSFNKKMESYSCPLLEVDSDKIVLTAHEAWYSDKSFILLKELPCREVMRVLSGEDPQSAVNFKNINQR